MTKSGSGILTHSAANSYSGGTTLAAGTLVFGNAAALGSGPVTFSGNSTLQAGDTFQLFSVSGSISQNSLTFDLPDLDAGLTWDFGGLTADGSLTVAVAGNGIGDPNFPKLLPSQLQALRDAGHTSATINPGTYHLADGFQYQSTFSLNGWSNFTIDCSDAVFTVGKQRAFQLNNCNNVTIKNLTVRARYPSFTQGRVLRKGNNPNGRAFAIWKISDGYPTEFTIDQTYVPVSNEVRAGFSIIAADGTTGIIDQATGDNYSCILTLGCTIEHSGTAIKIGPEYYWNESGYCWNLEHRDVAFPQDRRRPTLLHARAREKDEFIAPLVSHAFPSRPCKPVIHPMIPAMKQTRSHLIAGIYLASILSIGTTRAREAGVIDMATFGANADGSDTTPSLRAALDAARSGKASKLNFSPRRYDFRPERAGEQYLFVSNNDEGLKRIAFPLAGLEGLEIDGGGSTFVFHGYTVPFLLDNSRDITLRNFSVDFNRPFHSEGRVLAITTDHVDLEFSNEFPHEIRNGVLVFTDGKKASGPATTVTSGEVLYPYGSLLAFDPEKRETAFMAKDRYEVGAGIAAERISSNQVGSRSRIFQPKKGTCWSSAQETAMSPRLSFPTVPASV